MAKSKEELLEQLYAARKHSTLQDLADALEAYGFTKRPHRKRSGNTHVWTLGSCVVVLHRPHKQFAKPGAVDDVIASIERAEELRRTGNGKDSG